MEGPIGHNDIDPVLFAGVIYDLSAKEQKHHMQIRNTELTTGRKSSLTKLMLALETVTEKNQIPNSAFFFFLNK